MIKIKTNVYQLLGARALSEFSSNMYAIILPLIIFSISNSLANVGLYYSIIKIPSILLLPFLGLFVEKISRKKLIFFCNLSLLIIFWIQYLLFSSKNISMASLIFFGIVINVIASTNDIATRVIFSEIIPKDQLVQYNGTKSIIDNSTIFIAPMLGTFLFGIYGIKVVLILMIVLYGLATFGVYFLKYTSKSVAEKNFLMFLNTYPKVLSL